MQDVSILLDNRPGALADMGEALGRAGVSIEGGSAWVAGGSGAAHFFSLTELRLARRCRPLVYECWLCEMW